jgi:hypothetical protein
MTRAGNLITIDSEEVGKLIGPLLSEVEQSGRLVRIVRDGAIVAELRRPRRRVDPLKQHKELTGVQFHADPTAPLDDEDWPSELR